jgi:hypothetical protein
LKPAWILALEALSAAEVAALLAIDEGEVSLDCNGCAGVSIVTLA